jgi:hypothetical protein
MLRLKQVIMKDTPLACAAQSAVAANVKELQHLEQQLLAAGFRTAEAPAAGFREEVAAPAGIKAAATPATAAGGEVAGGEGGGRWDPGATAATASGPPSCTASCTARGPANCTNSGTSICTASNGTTSCTSEADSALTNLWLLEGFIYYLPRAEGDALLRWMADVSAPGSVLLMSVPPGQDEEEQRRDKEPLYHAVFEAPEEVMGRVVGAGWKLMGLVGADVLAERYGTREAHAIIRARV